MLISSGNSGSVYVIYHKLSIINGMINKVSIVIPVYNEENTVEKIISKVRDADVLGLEKEIVCINDCSTDNSKEVLETLAPKYDLSVYSQGVNKGKGAAIRRGFKEAKGEIIIIQDADLEYNPDEYKLLLKPIVEDGMDVVYGSRFLLAGPHKVLHFWHSLGNKFLTLLSNMFTNLSLTDMETCYKVFKKDLLGNFDLHENRFGFEPEFTAKLAKIKGIKIFEIPISYNHRSYEEGKKINWKDGVRAIYCIVKYSIIRK